MHDRLLITYLIEVGFSRITQANRNTLFTRYSRLSNRLYNRFDNRLYRVNKHPTGLSNRLSNPVVVKPGLTTVLNEQPLFVQPGWTNSYCSFNRLSIRFGNRFDNRLYRVNGA